MNSAAKYYVTHNNQKYGPMSWDQLLRYNFPPNAYYWTDGMANWQPLASVMPQHVNPQQNYAQPVNVDVFYDEDRYADFWQRFVAYLVDVVIFWIIAFFLGVILGGVFADMAFRNPGGFLFLTTFFNILSVWLYCALFESSEYQATPGKMLMKIKVVDKHFNRITFAQASGRYFSKILSSLILMIGYLMVLWSSQKQALHDQIANTLVVKKSV